MSTTTTSSSPPSSFPSPTAPPTATTVTATPSQNHSPTPSKLLTTYIPLSGLILAPTLLLLPPRKLDLYTLPLLTIFGISAEELGYGHFSGGTGYFSQKRPLSSTVGEITTSNQSKGIAKEIPASLAQAQKHEGIRTGTAGEVGSVKAVGAVTAAIQDTSTFPTSTSTTQQGNEPRGGGKQDGPGPLGGSGTWLRNLVGAGKKELLGGAGEPGVRDLGLGQRQPDTPTTHLNDAGERNGIIMGSAREIELGIRAQTLGWKDSWKHGVLGWERLGADGQVLLAFESPLPSGNSKKKGEGAGVQGIESKAVEDAEAKHGGKGLGRGGGSRAWQNGSGTVTRAKGGRRDGYRRSGDGSRKRGRGCGIWWGTISARLLGRERMMRTKAEGVRGEDLEKGERAGDVGGGGCI
ncbi:uncharacterized protein KY384_004746 [Bacidia gigantensis]|uniref:uncharacterized protein n=1 Tax=Bacidia gigantensis TaxID=2732470 RepID=UPI001D03EA65|nr:uncharacterized protein KY384_004746 [Bacidia gigantensis]KAG8530246.1 hypothetical protein KY384_004746 [Bacidia gigantensis]